MDKWVFSSDKIYKREEIAALADSIEEVDEYLVATTPSREYWFLPSCLGYQRYQLDHTWASFILGPRAA
jgi:hypothetical protein